MSRRSIGPLLHPIWRCFFALCVTCALAGFQGVPAQTPATAAGTSPSTTPSAPGASANRAVSPTAPLPPVDGSAAAPPAPAVATDAAARNPAAKINLVDGAVHTIGPDKVVRISKVGDQLYEGDAIVTGDGAEIHLDMADGGFIAVRPNTQMRIAKYQANGDEGDVSVIGLLKGSLRSITGWIGKTYPRKYAVVTPSATIGVRGTDHEPAYLPEDAEGASAGTYDTVHAGQTTIGNSHGTINVTPGHAGFVDHAGTVSPRVLERVPAFFAATRRNDGVFAGKHERIAAGLEQRRMQRLQEHREELRKAPLAPRSGSASPRTPLRPESSNEQPAARGGLAGLRDRLLQRGGLARPEARPDARPEARAGTEQHAAGQLLRRPPAESNPADRSPRVPPRKEPPKKQPTAGPMLIRDRDFEAGV